MGTNNEKTHWKKLMNKDYLGSWDFKKGEEKTVTIKSVLMGEVIDSNTYDKKQKPILYFVENIKPVVMNSTNAKRITDLFKSPHIEDWQGRKITLVVERFKAFGKMDEGIRIKQKLPAQNTPPICSDCQGEIRQIGEYTSERIAAKTKKKYGRPLCGDCKAKIDSQETKDESECVVYDSE